MISIELDGVVHRVYVRKRPGVDNFLRAVGEKYEVVVFTASLAKYADPLLDILDRSKTVKVRLFREACVQHYGNYVKVIIISYYHVIAHWLWYLMMIDYINIGFDSFGSPVRTNHHY